MLASPSDRTQPLARVRLVGSALVVVSVMAISGAATQKGETRPAINAFCPVMTEEKVDPSITTTYRGRTIAFCCDRCLAKFKADPERYAARLAATGEAARVARPSGSAPATTRRKDPLPESATATVHDHQQGGGESADERGPLLGRLHPVIVHFPVAGVPLALLCFLLWMVSGRRVFTGADVPPLILATLAAIAAVITGNIAHDATRFSASMHEIVERHELAGTTLMVLLLCLSAFRLWRWDRMAGRWCWIYVGSLLLASLLVGLTGFLGGSLVYGPDHFKW